MVSQILLLTIYQQPLIEDATEPPIDEPIS
jgi:hypothetical protein